MELQELKAQALAGLEQTADLEGLEAWRVRFLGRKGPLSQFLRSISSLPLEERRLQGESANRVKSSLQDAWQSKRESLRLAQVSTSQSGADISLPGRPMPLGRLHPITQTFRDICAAFQSLGFEVVEGPEVEWDYYNFEALNIPPGHAARDMFSTFWVDYTDDKGGHPMLLRTHTSPMQVRVMEKTEPPVRVVVPGQVFRYEATDATHEAVFHQVEGLAVDENITLADLKGTLYEVARLLFGEDRKARFRCTYFPFVEPGVDMAIDCAMCRGEGCRVCSGTGWLEILGAGMVHPNVLSRVGYDTQRYTGFAFGLGVERIAMLRHGIDDIRLFFQNDLRFLRQFR